MDLGDKVGQSSNLRFRLGNGEDLFLLGFLEILQKLREGRMDSETPCAMCGLESLMDRIFLIFFSSGECEFSLAQFSLHFPGTAVPSTFQLM